MPQPFNNAIITNAGARLLTRAQAGEVKIQFTRMAVGSGIYTAEEKELLSLQARTTLKEEKNSYPLYDIIVHSDHSVKMTALVTNADPASGSTLINDGYFINEMGIYAKEKDGADSTEVLYSIAVTAGEFGDFMPPYNGYYPVQIIQDYFATVNNSAQVTIKNDSAVVLREEFERKMALLRAELKTWVAYDDDAEALYITGGGKGREYTYDDENEALYLARDGGCDGGNELLDVRGGAQYEQGEESLDFSDNAGEILDGIMASYTLPAATADVLGGVKIGDGIKAAEDGTISVDVGAFAEEAAEIVSNDLNRVTGTDVKGLFGAGAD